MTRVFIKGVHNMSIAFYVGKDLTNDGSTLLGGFGHEPSSHWIDIVQAQNHPAGSKIQVGVTEEANMPGELITIPQVRHTYKYISSTYSNFLGFPPPLTNGGLNEHGVAGRDVWSDSRQELIDMTPEPQRGLNYSDLARIAMERATTAREAVEIAGGLINEYGYATYGGNSHLFADENEGWVMIEYAGGQGLWAAERLGSNDVRVSYPGYIHDFPVDFKNNDDYMGSDNIVDFAMEQGWWNPEQDDPNYLNLQDVDGVPFPGVGVDKEEDHFTAMRIPPEREEELLPFIPMSLEDMLALVRDPRWSNDQAGYGQVAHLRPGVHKDLQTLWLAVTGAVTTPDVPIPIVTKPSAVPPEFVQHRYLTKYSASEPLSPDYAMQEATRYATREFKRLLYFTCEHPVLFLNRLTGSMEKLEMKMLNERKALEEKYLSLLESQGADAAQKMISENVEKWLFKSLHLGKELTHKIETITRKRFGIRMPKGTEDNGETTPPWSQSMVKKPDEPYVNCYDPELDVYPRKFGIYSKDED